MNIRKPTDYTAMFAALDTLMAAQLPQIELYCEIGRLVSGRAEKGAAVAASEYLQAAYPATEGFSPRNLRRMRAFYAAYEESPEIMRLAMNLGWTRNVAILERCGSNEERTWYIRAVLHFGWKKAKLNRSSKCEQIFWICPTCYFCFCFKRLQMQAFFISGIDMKDKSAREQKSKNKSAKSKIVRI